MRTIKILNNEKPTAPSFLKNMVPNISRPRVVNQIPGQNFGLKNMKQVQEFNNLQARVKGFTFNTAVGQQDFNLKLPGQISMFLGINLFDNSGSPNGVATLKVNTDIKIESLTWIMLTNVQATAAIPGSNYNGQYHQYLFPLSGNDDIILNYNADIAGVLNIGVWFI